MRMSVEDRLCLYGEWRDSALWKEFGPRTGRPNGEKRKVKSWKPMWRYAAMCVRRVVLAELHPYRWLLRMTDDETRRLRAHWQEYRLLCREALEKGEDWPQEQRTRASELRKNIPDRVLMKLHSQIAFTVLNNLKVASTLASAKALPPPHDGDTGSAIDGLDSSGEGDSKNQQGKQRGTYFSLWGGRSSPRQGKGTDTPSGGGGNIDRGLPDLPSQTATEEFLECEEASSEIGQPPPPAFGQPGGDAEGCPGSGGDISPLRSLGENVNVRRAPLSDKDSVPASPCGSVLESPLVTQRDEGDGEDENRDLEGAVPSMTATPLSTNFRQLHQLQEAHKQYWIEKRASRSLSRSQLESEIGGMGVEGSQSMMEDDDEFREEEAEFHEAHEELQEDVKREKMWEKKKPYIWRWYMIREADTEEESLRQKRESARGALPAAITEASGLGGQPFLTLRYSVGRAMVEVQLESGRKRRRRSMGVPSSSVFLGVEKVFLFALAGNPGTVEAKIGDLSVTHQKQITQQAEAMEKTKIIYRREDKKALEHLLDARYTNETNAAGKVNNELKVKLANFHLNCQRHVFYEIKQFVGQNQTKQSPSELERAAAQAHKRRKTVAVGGAKGSTATEGGSFDATAGEPAEDGAAAAAAVFVQDARLVDATHIMASSQHRLAQLSTWHIDISLSAPTLLLPEEIADRKTAFYAVNLGELTVLSASRCTDPEAKEREKTVAACTATRDHHPVRNMRTTTSHYSSFRVALSKISVLHCDDLENYITGAMSFHKDVLPETEMDFHLLLMTFFEREISKKELAELKLKEEREARKQAVQREMGRTGGHRGSKRRSIDRCTTSISIGDDPDKRPGSPLGREALMVPSPGAARMGARRSSVASPVGLTEFAQMGGGMGFLPLQAGLQPRDIEGSGEEDRERESGVDAETADESFCSAAASVRPPKPGSTAPPRTHSPSMTATSAGAAPESNEGMKPIGLVEGAPISLLPAPAVGLESQIQDGELDSGQVTPGSPAEEGGGGDADVFGEAFGHVKIEGRLRPVEIRVNEASYKGLIKMLRVVLMDDLELHQRAKLRAESVFVESRRGDRKDSGLSAHSIKSRRSARMVDSTEDDGALGGLRRTSVFPAMVSQFQPQQRKPSVAPGLSPGLDRQRLVSPGVRKSFVLPNGPSGGKPESPQVAPKAAPMLPPKISVSEPDRLQDERAMQRREERAKHRLPSVAAEFFTEKVTLRLYCLDMDREKKGTEKWLASQKRATQRVALAIPPSPGKRMANVVEAVLSPPPGPISMTPAIALSESGRSAGGGGSANPSIPVSPSSAKRSSASAQGQNPHYDPVELCTDSMRLALQVSAARVTTLTFNLRELSLSRPVQEAYGGPQKQWLLKSTVEAIKPRVRSWIQEGGKLAKERSGGGGNHRRARSVTSGQGSDRGSLGHSASTFVGGGGENENEKQVMSIKVCMSADKSKQLEHCEGAPMLIDLRFERFISIYFASEAFASIVRFLKSFPAPLSPLFHQINLGPSSDGTKAYARSSTLVKLQQQQKAAERRPSSARPTMQQRFSIAMTKALERAAGGSPRHAKGSGGAFVPSSPQRSPSAAGANTSGGTGTVRSPNMSGELSLERNDSALDREPENALGMVVRVSVHSIRLFALDDDEVEDGFASVAFEESEISLKMRALTVELRCRLKNFAIDYILPLTPEDFRQKEDQPLNPPPGYYGEYFWEKMWGGKKRNRDDDPLRISDREVLSILGAFDSAASETASAGSGHWGGNRSASSVRNFLSVHVETFAETLDTYDGFAFTIDVHFSQILFNFLMGKFLKIFNWILGGFLPAILASPRNTEQIKNETEEEKRLHDLDRRESGRYKRRSTTEGQEEEGAEDEYEPEFSDTGSEESDESDSGRRFPLIFTAHDLYYYRSIILRHPQVAQVETALKGDGAHGAKPSGPPSPTRPFSAGSLGKEGERGGRGRSLSPGARGLRWRPSRRDSHGRRRGSRGSSPGRRGSGDSAEGEGGGDLPAFYTYRNSKYKTMPRQKFQFRQGPKHKDPPPAPGQNRGERWTHATLFVPPEPLEFSFEDPGEKIGMTGKQKIERLREESRTLYEMGRKKFKGPQWGPDFTKVDFTAPIRLMKLEVFVDTPVIFVPLKTNSRKMLQLRVPSVTVSNQKMRHAAFGPQDVIVIAFNGVDAQAIIGDRRQLFLPKTNISFAFIRSILPCQIPVPMWMQIQMSEVQWRFTSDRFNFFVAVLFGNILGTDPHLDPKVPPSEEQSKAAQSPKESAEKDAAAKAGTQQAATGDAKNSLKPLVVPASPLRRRRSSSVDRTAAQAAQGAAGRRGSGGSSGRSSSRSVSPGKLKLASSSKKPQSPSSRSRSPRRDSSRGRTRVSLPVPNRPPTIEVEECVDLHCLSTDVMEADQRERVLGKIALKTGEVSPSDIQLSKKLQETPMQARLTKAYEVTDEEIAATKDCRELETMSNETVRRAMRAAEKKEREESTVQSVKMWIQFSLQSLSFHFLESKELPGQLSRNSVGGARGAGGMWGGPQGPDRPIMGEAEFLQLRVHEITVDIARMFDRNMRIKVALQNTMLSANDMLSPYNLLISDQSIDLKRQAQVFKDRAVADFKSFQKRQRSSHVTQLPLPVPHDIPPLPEQQQVQQFRVRASHRRVRSVDSHRGQPFQKHISVSTPSGTKFNAHSPPEMLPEEKSGTKRNDTNSSPEDKGSRRNTSAKVRAAIRTWSPVKDRNATQLGAGSNPSAVVRDTSKEKHEGVESEEDGEREGKTPTPEMEQEQEPEFRVWLDSSPGSSQNIRVAINQPRTILAVPPLLKVFRFFIDPKDWRNEQDAESEDDLFVYDSEDSDSETRSVGCEDEWEDKETGDIPDDPVPNRPMHRMGTFRGGGQRCRRKTMKDHLFDFRKKQMELAIEEEKKKQDSKEEEEEEGGGRSIQLNISNSCLFLIDDIKSRRSPCMVVRTGLKICMRSRPSGDMWVHLGMSDCNAACFQDIDTALIYEFVKEERRHVIPGSQLGDLNVSEVDGDDFRSAALSRSGRSDRAKFQGGALAMSSDDVSNPARRFHLPSGGYAHQHRRKEDAAGAQEMREALESADRGTGQRAGAGGLGKSGIHKPSRLSHDRMHYIFNDFGMAVVYTRLTKATLGGEDRDLGFGALEGDSLMCNQSELVLSLNQNALHVSSRDLTLFKNFYLWNFCATEEELYETAPTAAAAALSRISPEPGQLPLPSGPSPPPSERPFAALSDAPLGQGQAQGERGSVVDAQMSRSGDQLSIGEVAEEAQLVHPALLNINSGPQDSSLPASRRTSLASLLPPASPQQGPRLSPSRQTSRRPSAAPAGRTWRAKSISAAKDQEPKPAPATPKPPRLNVIQTMKHQLTSMWEDKGDRKRRRKRERRRQRRMSKEAEGEDEKTPDWAETETEDGRAVYQTMPVRNRLMIRVLVHEFCLEIVNDLYKHNNAPFLQLDIPFLTFKQIGIRDPPGMRPFQAHIGRDYARRTLEAVLAVWFFNPIAVAFEPLMEHFYVGVENIKRPLIDETEEQERDLIAGAAEQLQALNEDIERSETAGEKRDFKKQPIPLGQEPPPSPAASEGGKKNKAAGARLADIGRRKYPELRPLLDEAERGGIHLKAFGQNDETGAPSAAESRPGEEKEAQTPPWERIEERWKIWNKWARQAPSVQINISQAFIQSMIINASRWLDDAEHRKRTGTYRLREEPANTTAGFPSRSSVASRAMGRNALTGLPQNVYEEVLENDEGSEIEDANVYTEGNKVLPPYPRWWSDPKDDTRMEVILDCDSTDVHVAEYKKSKERESVAGWKRRMDEGIIEEEADDEDEGEDDEDEEDEHEEEIDLKEADVVEGRLRRRRKKMMEEVKKVASAHMRPEPRTRLRFAPYSLKNNCGIPLIVEMKRMRRRRTVNIKKEPFMEIDRSTGLSREGLKQNEYWAADSVTSSDESVREGEGENWRGPERGVYLDTVEPDSTHLGTVRRGRGDHPLHMRTVRTTQISVPMHWEIILHDMTVDSGRLGKRHRRGWMRRIRMLSAAEQAGSGDELMKGKSDLDKHAASRPHKDVRALGKTALAMKPAERARRIWREPGGFRGVYREEELGFVARGGRGDRDSALGEKAERGKSATSREAWDATRPKPDDKATFKPHVMRSVTLKFPEEPDPGDPDGPRRHRPCYDDIVTVPLEREGVFVFELKPVNHQTVVSEVEDEEEERNRRRRSSVPASLSDPDGPQTRFLPEMDGREDGAKDFILCRVVAEEACKKLLVESQVIILNEFEHVVEMAVNAGNMNLLGVRGLPQGDDAHKGRIIRVESGAAIAIPVTMCRTGVLQFRPVTTASGRHYQWSDRCVRLRKVWEDLDKKEKQKDRTALQMHLRSQVRKPGQGPRDIPAPALASPVEVNSEDDEKESPDTRRSDFHFHAVINSELCTYQGTSCKQITIGLRAPVRLRSCLPLPVRYRIRLQKVEITTSSFYRGRDLDNHPFEATGVLKTNESTFLHNLPFRSDPAFHFSQNKIGTTSREQNFYRTRALIKLQVFGSSEDRNCYSNEQLIFSNDPVDRDTAHKETESLSLPDHKRSRFSKINLIFLNSPGYPVDIILHVPVWILSHNAGIPRGVSEKEAEEMCKTKKFKLREHDESVTVWGSSDTSGLFWERAITDMDQQEEEKQRGLRGVAKDALVESEDSRWLAPAISPLDCKANLVHLRVGGQRSKQVDLRSALADGFLSVDGRDGRRLEFGLRVLPSVGLQLWKDVRCLNFYPRYVVVNDLDFPLLFKQKDSKEVFSVKARERLPFHWPSGTGPQLVQVKLAELDWEWSAPFSIGELLEVSFRMVVRRVKKGWFGVGQMTGASSSVAKERKESESGYLGFGGQNSFGSSWFSSWAGVSGGGDGDGEGDEYEAGGVKNFEDWNGVPWYTKGRSDLLYDRSRDKPKWERDGMNPSMDVRLEISQSQGVLWVRFRPHTDQLSNARKIVNLSNRTLFFRQESMGPRDKDRAKQNLTHIVDVFRVDPGCRVDFAWLDPFIGEEKRSIDLQVAVGTGGFSNVLKIDSSAPTTLRPPEFKSLLYDGQPSTDSFSFQTQRVYNRIELSLFGLAEQRQFEAKGKDEKRKAAARKRREKGKVFPVKESDKRADGLIIGTSVLSGHDACRSIPFTEIAFEDPYAPHLTDGSPNLVFDLFLSSVSVSIIASTQQQDPHFCTRHIAASEILLMTIEDIRMRRAMSPRYQATAVTVHNVQIDNQNGDTLCPIFLQRSDTGMVPSFESLPLDQEADKTGAGQSVAKQKVGKVDRKRDRVARRKQQARLDGMQKKGEEDTTLRPLFDFFVRQHTLPPEENKTEEGQAGAGVSTVAVVEELFPPSALPGGGGERGSVEGEGEGEETAEHKRVLFSALQSADRAGSGVAEPLSAGTRGDSLLPLPPPSASSASHGEGDAVAVPGEGAAEEVEEDEEEIPEAVVSKTPGEFLFYDTIKVTLQGIVVQLDMNLVNALLYSLWEVQQTLKTKSAAKTDEVNPYSAAISDGRTESEGRNLPHHHHNRPKFLRKKESFEIPPLIFDPFDESARLYVETLHIDPVFITLSFKLTLNSGQVFANYDNPIVRFILSLGSIDAMSMNFHPFQLNHECCRMASLASRMSVFYKQTALQTAKYIGLSLEVMGNPASLIASIGGGVTNLVYKPIQGASAGYKGSSSNQRAAASSADARDRSPSPSGTRGRGRHGSLEPDSAEEGALATAGGRRRSSGGEEAQPSMVGGMVGFGHGIVEGVSGLGSAVLASGSTSISKIAGTMSQALGVATFDDEYVRGQHERHLMQRPQNFGEGLQYGITSMGRGVLEGLTGLVTQPAQGAQEEGVEGFVKGVGKGVAGAFVKPVAGTLDFIAQGAQGVQVLAQPATERERKRLPRMLYGPDRVMRDFQQRDSEMKLNLYFVEGCKKWAHAAIMAYVWDRKAAKISVFSDGFFFIIDCLSGSRRVVLDLEFWQVLEVGESPELGEADFSLFSYAAGVDPNAERFGVDIRWQEKERDPSYGNQRRQHKMRIGLSSRDRAKELLGLLEDFSAAHHTFGVVRGGSKRDRHTGTAAASSGLVADPSNVQMTDFSKAAKSRQPPQDQSHHQTRAPPRSRLMRPHETDDDSERSSPPRTQPAPTPPLDHSTDPREANAVSLSVLQSRSHPSSIQPGRPPGQRTSVIHFDRPLAPGAKVEGGGVRRHSGAGGEGEVGGFQPPPRNYLPAFSENDQLYIVKQHSHPVSTSTRSVPPPPHGGGRESEGPSDGGGGNPRPTLSDSTTMMNRWW
uniref:Vacuolar protein sorting-associated protein 13 VPS13 adaptor binding domain-containing protein n=1 Tax=Chromera velia CCMP2878 TaxID=1169474 RepID=A0A0G4F6M6_9ALVE|eukprot:Cvel_15468.t1-p1 / transcript=Cvel_15468.t1 / gene=Cvel_15468 / organism=Chromera_velia_CCMP2878 / gene_product=Putative vacuolar protein sorting-associated, putative / transcript_product=Putative vacuolar protein sorting-associated, putative / location=Cvel_scaffold1146:23051-51873(-) / protein_length=6267 / sequence_SO=supercontig / SO=protein_coding / is_pseudo=false